MSRPLRIQYPNAWYHVIISRIVQNTKISDMHNLLSQGHDMQHIAGHYNMDLPLGWALRLAGKTDQEKFKELGWGLRTWDQWNFNECLPREIHEGGRSRSAGACAACRSADLKK